MPDLSVDREREAEEGPSVLEEPSADGGQDVEGPRVPLVPEDFHKRPGSTIESGRGPVGGSFRARDPAAEWLDQHARDEALLRPANERIRAVAKARRASGILTRHQEDEIRAWEVPLFDDE